MNQSKHHLQMVAEVHHDRDVVHSATLLVKLISQVETKTAVFSTEEAKWMKEILQFVSIDTIPTKQAFAGQKLLVTVFSKAIGSTYRGLQRGGSIPSRFAIDQQLMKCIEDVASCQDVELLDSTIENVIYYFKEEVSKYVRPATSYAAH